jgi:hypothetical protein
VAHYIADLQWRTALAAPFAGVSEPPPPRCRVYGHLPTVSTEPGSYNFCLAITGLEQCKLKVRLPGWFLHASWYKPRFAFMATVCTLALMDPVILCVDIATIIIYTTIVTLS